ncbi:MAG TPA: hypothetical protein VGH22_05490 [Candidatus Binatia bacterium]
MFRHSCASRVRLSSAWSGAAAALPAARHRYRVYRNPSITIHAIAEDQRGLLWLGAADGVYRFDGFHFQKLPGFSLDSARYLAVTPDGSVWTAGKQGLARWNGAFQILARDEISGMAAGTDRVYIGEESGI